MKIVKWILGFYVKIVIAPLLLFILMYDDQRQNWEWDCVLCKRVGLPITPWEVFYEPFCYRVKQYFIWKVYN